MTKKKLEFFPGNTCNWMLDKAEKAIASEQVNPLNVPVTFKLIKKLAEIEGLDGNDKKNRWFGYYLHLGEELGLWTLDEMIKLVRDEREAFLKMDNAAKTRLMLQQEAQRCKNLYKMMQEQREI